MRKIMILLLLLWAPFVLAQQTQTQPEADKGTYDQTAKEIEQKILKEDKVKIDQFKVLHKDDSVYLEGVADRYGSYYYAGEIARKFKGIKNVDNEIVIRKKNVRDEDLQGTLIQIAQKKLFSEPFDLIQVKVSHGFVTLLGSVRDSSLKDKIFKEAIWVPGVLSVEDKIQLASISANDDRLRVLIFQLLRRDFPQYFRGAHPSVVILVEHGRVALVGYVDSNADKQRMLTGVRGLTGVLSVQDQLQAE